MAASGTEGAKRAASGQRRHVPVLLLEVLEKLSPRADHTYIDGTFGAGGYTSAILEVAGCRVLAIDRDPAVAAVADALAEKFPDRLSFRAGRFSDMQTLAADAGVDSVDGIVLDIGLSSMQLEASERGFSFLRDGPLDMRMSGTGPSASDIVNSYDERDLAFILKTYGEERRGRAIARKIIAARAQKPIETTLELAAIICEILGPPRGDAIHPATRSFQALRIHVNDELGELTEGLVAAERLLAPGGRLVVVSFHSLEDRIVKRFLRKRAGKTARPSRHLPEPEGEQLSPSFQIINSRPLGPSNEEVKANPRARSARLRAAIRSDAPAWPADEHGPRPGRPAGV